MSVLEIRGLTKHYPAFTLQDVSFTLEKGSIMGLIGRNGAGKTTTMKSILNLIRPDAGEISFFGMPLQGNEMQIKQRIGYSGGAVNYYPRKKLERLAQVTSRFYPNWSEESWQKYCRVFKLDQQKTPAQLSQGMKVKLNLALALSHGAELLILDEPTSGLDPVSRQELLDILRYVGEQGTAILFSTHIITDLEKCADHITYIRQGQVHSTGTLDAFLQDGRAAGLGDTLEQIMLGLEKEDFREKLAE